MKQLTKLPRAIAFDLDGTLADTIGQLAAAINDMLVALNHDPLPVDQIRSYVGDGQNLLIVRSLLQDATINDVNAINNDLLQQARALFGDSYMHKLPNGFKLYDGVKESLEHFNKLGIKLFVVSNKPHRFVVPLIEYMGLQLLFTELLGSEVLKERKPNAKPLLYLLDKYNIKPQEAIMVGDSVNDLRCAQNAHAKSVIFTFGYHGNTDIENCGADFIFDSFWQLNDLITSIE